MDQNQKRNVRINLCNNLVNDTVLPPPEYLRNNTKKNDEYILEVVNFEFTDLVLIVTEYHGFMSY